MVKIRLCCVCLDALSLCCKSIISGSSRPPCRTATKITAGPGLEEVVKYVQEQSDRSTAHLPTESESLMSSLNT